MTDLFYVRETRMTGSNTILTVPKGFPDYYRPFNTRHLPAMCHGPSFPFRETKWPLPDSPAPARFQSRESH